MTPYDQTLARMTISLTRLARSYKAAADRMASDYGLSLASAWPVVTVHRMGDGVRAGALAEALHLEPPSVVRVVDNLVEAGLLERRDDPGDRRAKTLHLTAAGHERARQLEEALIPFRRTLFEGVSFSDIEACLRVFDALDAAVKRYGEAAPEEP